jgi:hypothetical protein
MLSDNDLSGLGSSTRSFFQNIHKRMGADNSGGGDIASEGAQVAPQLAGRMYADTYARGPKMDSLDADRAADLGRDLSAQANAIGAPAGSIAARANPDQYGTVASRQFGQTFQSGALDPENNAINAADPDARQGLQQRFRNQALSGG